jgi:hypothetical protein
VQRRTGERDKTRDEEEPGGNAARGTNDAKLTDSTSGE